MLKEKVNKFKDITDEQLRCWLLDNARQVGNEQKTQAIILELIRRELFRTTTII